MQLPKLLWSPSPNFSSRIAHVELIVVHDCEGSYEGAIEWFGESKSNVSAHLVLKEDGTEATQCVDFRMKAWHACAFNSRSIGIEMGGFAARGFPATEWQCLANVTAYLLRAYGLPCRWAHGGAGTGFTSHADLGAAGGGHHDPVGPTDPMWLKFIGLVTQAYNAGGFPANWGRGVPPNVLTPVVPIQKHDVFWAQRAINVIRHSQVLTVDGILGQHTKDAIAKFQSENKLLASGNLDDATITALARATSIKT